MIVTSHVGENNRANVLQSGIEKGKGRLNLSLRTQHLGLESLITQANLNFQPHLPSASFPPPKNPRRRCLCQAECTPASLTGISESLHGGACHNLLHPLLSNRDGVASNVGGNWRRQILTTSPVKPRGHFQPSSAH